MRWLALLLALASPAGAQEFTEAEGGLIRWLDKLTGASGDVELVRGQSASNGRLTIQLDNCRYPSDNPVSDANAHLTILDSLQEAPVFQGWMLASSPALSAMDHPRYDVWVLRCTVPEGAVPEVEEE
ncbi:MAG: DUF2155 domain-containing protein [Tabrizicola sp.]|nr:DUF2155 domain-containing protein [Tabrizicola sp.]